MKPYEKLQQYWNLSSAEVSENGATEADVAALEQRYDVRLPADFRDYLVHSCPKDETAGVDWPTSWWQLDRIRNIPDEYEHPIADDVIARDAEKYIFFADFAIWCWAWAICCNDGENHGRIAIISGQEQFVAESFAQFVELYIEDGGGSKRLAAS